MTSKTYMITGGAGFLGINLVRYLLDRGHKVVSLDIASFDYPEKDRVKIVTGDIRDRSSVDRAMEGVDLMLCPSTSSGSCCWRDPCGAWRPA